MKVKARHPDELLLIVITKKFNYKPKTINIIR